MYEFQTLGVSWPPRGWEKLKDIQYYTGQAIIKNPVSAKVAGLIYKIEPLSFCCNHEKGRCCYAIQIDGWEYTIRNESREYPVLSFILQEKLDDDLVKKNYIDNIKVKSRSIRVTRFSAYHSLMASLFLMKQIDSGCVPDIEQILKLYKIHPLQKKLCGEKKTHNTSLYCGLLNYNFNNNGIKTV